MPHTESFQVDDEDNLRHVLTMLLLKQWTTKLNTSLEVILNYNYSKLIFQIEFLQLWNILK